MVLKCVQKYKKAINSMFEMKKTYFYTECFTSYKVFKAHFLPFIHLFSTIEEIPYSVTFNFTKMIFVIVL